MSDVAKREGGLTLREKRLLQAAANGWSGLEIEREYGIPAAAALVQIRELLKARNIFTDLERRQLLLYSVYQLKERIEGEALDLDNPRSVEAYTKVIKSLNDMLEKQTAVSEEEMAMAARAQARALLGLIEAAWQHARKLLNDEYGDVVDVPRIEDAFNQGLREVAQEHEDEDL